jgi:hypothetical protein
MDEPHMLTPDRSPIADIIQSNIRIWRDYAVLKRDGVRHPNL